MATAPDFKAMVMESVRRSSAEGRLPRRGEALLIGHAASGGLIRLRVPRVYRWFDALMVRGFIKQKALDGLGILIGDDYQAASRAGSGWPSLIVATPNLAGSARTAISPGWLAQRDRNGPGFAARCFRYSVDPGRSRCWPLSFRLK